MTDDSYLKRDDIDSLKSRFENMKSAFDNLIEMNPYSVALFDKGGHFIKGNSAFYKMFHNQPPAPEYSIFEDALILSYGLGEKLEGLKNGNAFVFPTMLFSPHLVKPEYPEIPIYIEGVVFPLANSNGETEQIVTMYKDVTEKKKYEKELKDVVSNFSIIVEDSAYAYGKLDLEGNIIYLNKRAEVITGFNKEELIGHKMSEFLMPEDLQRADNDMKLALEQPNDGPREYPVTCKDGAIKLLEINTVPYKEAGEIAGFQFTALDITTRMEAQDEIRKLNQFLEVVIDNANVWLNVLDENANVLIWNEAAAAISGYAKDEVVGHSMIWEWLYPDAAYKKNIVDKANSIINRGVMVEGFETCITTKNGDKKIISWYSRNILGTDGASIGSVALGRDVTEQKKADEALRDYGAFQSVLADVRGVGFEESEEMLIRTFLKSTKENYSLTFALYSNYEKGIIQPLCWFGKNISGLSDVRINIHNQFSDKDVKAMSKAVKQGKPFGYQDLVNDESISEWKYFLEAAGFSSNLALPVMVEGQTEGIVILYSSEKYSFPHDRSERLFLLVRELGAILSEWRRRQRTIDENEMLMRQLVQAQKMEAIGTLAGGMAHDFNNILAVIMGTSTSALSQMDEGDPNYARFERILNSSRRAKELTMNLLTFARKEKLNVGVTSINIILKEINDMIKRSISKKIIIETRFKEELSNIKVDSNQVQQAILNICLNACDAMPDGGVLRISTGIETFESLDEKNFPEANPGDYCYVQIRDTGKGIPGDILNNIFDPFFTTKPKGEGTGLGLSITMGIIQSHNGFMTIKTNEVEGTVVRAYLPVTEESILSDRKNNLEFPEGDNETVMIIDDDPDVLDMIVEAIEIEGYNSIVANTGKDAVEKYIEHSGDIDVVMLDIMMPDLDGNEIYRKLKKINPEIKVIVCSGYSLDGKVGELVQSGTNFYLQKPFDMQELCIMLRKAIDS